ncbi:arrestin homolog, partial [Anoplophora glabripennis]|uniref:arrestin homolog n=1 Tax=Anoplophora glabripennis TaxID=217634 RepID=UPI000873F160
MTTEDSSGPSAAPDSGSKAENSKAENGRPETATGAIPDGMNAQRVFKKASPNQKLTLYLSSRDLVVSSGGIDRLQGVLLVDPEFVENRKVYGQVTLTFRYGREDEEVMGLKFCNEAIMCLAQLYPPHPGTPDTITPLQ